MGNFTRGLWLQSQDYMRLILSKIHLISPAFLLSLTLNHDKNQPHIFTPHKSHDSRNCLYYTSTIKNPHPRHQLPPTPTHLTFTNHIGHNAIMPRVVGSSTSITHQLVQVTRAESPRCFLCALETLTIGIPIFAFCCWRVDDQHAANNQKNSHMAHWF